MSAYTIESGERAVHGKQLAAGVADTVEIADGSEGLGILSDGSGDLYFSLDGTAATIEGAHCYLLPEDASSVTLAVSLAPGASVALISAAAMTYSVVLGDVEIGGGTSAIIDGGTE